MYIPNYIVVFYVGILLITSVVPMQMSITCVVNCASKLKSKLKNNIVIII